MSNIEASPAATLILVRSGTPGLEVLLLKRSASARFMPNAYVFPGGSVDACDADPVLYDLCANFDDARASARLGLAAHGLRFFIAAVRECLEECGILLAYDRAGQLLEGAVPNTADLAAWCELNRLRLAVDRLHYFSHWITPIGYHRRFDTRFFLTQAPAGQQASLAGGEMQEFVWISPARALAAYEATSMQLMYPTRTILAELTGFDSPDEVLISAQAKTRIETVMPTLPRGGAA